MQKATICSCSLGDFAQRSLLLFVSCFIVGLRSVVDPATCKWPNQSHSSSFVSYHTSLCGLSLLFLISKLISKMLDSCQIRKAISSRQSLWFQLEATGLHLRLKCMYLSNSGYIASLLVLVMIDEDWQVTWRCSTNQRAKTRFETRF